MPAGLRSGIIGTGFMGSVHAHAVRAAGGTVVAVAGRTGAGAERAAESLGALHAAASPEALIERDVVDVVHICTRTRPTPGTRSWPSPPARQWYARSPSRHPSGTPPSSRNWPSRPGRSLRCRSCTGSTPAVRKANPQGYQDSFNAFVADVYAAERGGTPEGLPTFVDGLRAAQLTQALITSAQEGGWVAVPLHREPVPREVSTTI